MSLTLGAPLDPLNLMKGIDVYLECGIKSNPPVKKVVWFQQVSCDIPSIGPIKIG